MRSEAKHPPRVGIGLPVWNGERYVGEAIQSILDQTFENLQLLIGDNCSTDGTEEICRSFESDPRVTYVRRERNLGATPNYNQLMDRLRSPLVRWHACDDVLAPTYLEACVNLLDDDPGAPMAHTEAIVIDGTGRQIREWDGESSFQTDSAVDRWNAVAEAPDWHTIFGLVRREIMDRVGNFPLYPGSDRWVLGGGFLHGRPRFTSERLFIWRDHEETFRRSANLDQTAAEQWWSTDLRTWPLRTTMLGLRHGRGVIARSPLERPDRARCRGILNRQVTGPVIRRFHRRFKR